MADGTNNIYIDISFLSLNTDGAEDKYVDYTVREADNIGERIIPVELELVTTASGYQFVPMNYTTLSGLPGFVSTAVTYETDTTMSGALTSLIEYSIPITSSGLSGEFDADLEYFAVKTKVSGSQDERVDITVGDAFAFSDNILNQYWTFASTSGTFDYYALYTAGTPITIELDYQAQFTVNTTMSGSVGAVMESFFPGYPMTFRPEDFTHRFDLICGLESVDTFYDWEATVISGAVLTKDFDVYCGIVGTPNQPFDVYAGTETSAIIDWEIETVSGTIGYFDCDLYCGVSGVQGFNFDVSLFSLKISNFSLAEGEYTNSSGTICVDITDDVYNVVTSGTYFIIDGTTTSGIFTPITDGYRMCYDPVDDFSSLLGATTFTVHAENDNGDSLERDFYLTFGYMVDYDNRIQNYGFDQVIDVRMTAENLTSCPTSATFAYGFESVERVSKDLGASIVGIPWSEKDLTASISPQTDTIYFYGKTFTVEVRARDFAGNVMPPYIFEFRIEDEPD